MASSLAESSRNRSNEYYEGQPWSLPKQIVEAKVTFRQATADDVPTIMRCRGEDSLWGPADPRTALYLAGTHHPQSALATRVMFVAISGPDVAGYIAGHLTERYDLDGELQYLWVAPHHRRHGVASRLFDLLAGWFNDQGAKQICVDVEPDNLVARSFYSRHGAVELNSYWLVWHNMGTESEVGGAALSE